MQACSLTPETSAMPYEFTYTEADFKMLSSSLYEWTGIQLQPEKKQMLYSRLSKRLRSLNIRDFESYRDYLLHGSNDEKSKFISCLTTNLTSFFREKHHFDHLESTALPQLHQHPLICRKTRKPTLKIWSTACSSGEEPYSIAAVLSAYRLTKSILNAQCHYRILATDIDQDIIQKAEAGHYQLGAQHNIPQLYQRALGIEKRLRRDRDEDLSPSLIIPENLKQMIAFKTLNLTGQWPLQGPFDIIFCRNVLIYFDRETQIDLIKRLGALLRPGGWLYIGHAEFFDAKISYLQTDGRTIYRKKGELSDAWTET